MNPVSHSQIGTDHSPVYHVGMGLKLNIRALRQERKLTIAQLAEVIGVSTPHLSEVERGVKNLNNHLMERLAVALNVTPAQLIASEANDIDQRFVITYEALNPADKARVERFARDLLASQEDS